MHKVSRFKMHINAVRYREERYVCGMKEKEKEKENTKRSRRSNSLLVHRGCEGQQNTEPGPIRQGISRRSSYL